MKISKNTAKVYAFYEKYSKQYYVYGPRITPFFINIQWNLI